MIASPLQLLIPFLFLVSMDFKELHPQLGSPPGVADRPGASGTAQTTNGGAGSQSSPSRTPMFDVVMEAETRVNVSASLGNIHDRDDSSSLGNIHDRDDSSSLGNIHDRDDSSSLGNIHDRDDQSGRTPQHRACHHWAVQWPALQNGCLNPRGAVLERLQTYIEAGVVSNVILPGRDLLSLRATAPLLGGTSFTATLGAGRGAGCGIASGGSPASRQACPRDSTPTQMPSCLASNSMTLCVCTPVWQWTWVRVPVRGGPALLRSLLHPGAVNGWSMADATVDAGSRLGARTLTRIAPTCTCACTVPRPKCPDRNAQPRPSADLPLARRERSRAGARDAGSLRPGRCASDDARVDDACKESSRPADWTSSPRPSSTPTTQSSVGWLITTLCIFGAVAFRRASTKTSRRPRDQSIVVASRQEQQSRVCSNTGKARLLLPLLVMSTGEPSIAQQLGGNRSTGRPPSRGRCRGRRPVHQHLRLAGRWGMRRWWTGRRVHRLHSGDRLHRLRSSVEGTAVGTAIADPTVQLRVRRRGGRPHRRRPHLP